MAPPFFGPPAHAALGRGHFALRGFRDFSRFGANRMGPDRFGFNRFSNDHFGFNRFGFNRFGFNRFGFNANALSFGLLGLDGFGSWGYPQPFPATPAAPIVVDAGGPSVAINVYTGGGAGDPAAAGACVIHRLEYDKAGHYVGERQIPEC
jgi:hypothetical protein